MTFAPAVPLDDILRRRLDLTVETVALGVRRLRHRFDPAANARPALGRALAVVRRLTRIMRFVFVILASHLARVAPIAAHLPRPRATRQRSPLQRTARQPSFRVLPRYAIAYDDTPPQPAPAQLQAGVRDPFVTLQRRLGALSRALTDPMAHVRRLARRLPDALMVIGWRPPKRLPSCARREYWEEQLDAWEEAWRHLRAFRAWRRDSS